MGHMRGKEKATEEQAKQSIVQWSNHVCFRCQRAPVVAVERQHPKPMSCTCRLCSCVHTSLAWSSLALSGSGSACLLHEPILLCMGKSPQRMQWVRLRNALLNVPPSWREALVNLGWFFLPRAGSVPWMEREESSPSLLRSAYFAQTPHRSVPESRFRRCCRFFLFF